MTARPDGSLTSVGSAAVQGEKLQGRRRASPSPAEQARREAWGKEWGKRIADGYHRMLQERA